VIDDDVLVSRFHARVWRVGAQLKVADLGSRNGTYHRGRRIRTSTLSVGEEFSVGRRHFRYNGSSLWEYIEHGPVSLRAIEVTVRRAGNVILDSVSFSLEPGQLLAIVGPSGAGKSTLLRAVGGTAPADSGEVRYAGRDLYANYDELRHSIGFVPQDDVVHPQLPVRRALEYAARLRFAEDVGRAGRSARVDEVMAQLALTSHQDKRIGVLSGGQRKRASVALELLTRPALLLLDEPGAGLDPALDRDLMQVLRGLADGGRTVVLTTHNVLHLSTCHRVLFLAPGGRVAYFGPPDALLAYFGADEYADAFAEVELHGDRWARRYRDRTAAAAPRTAPSPRDRRTAPRSSARGGLRQLAVLATRSVAVAAADRLHVALTLGLPLALALLVHAVPGSAGLGPSPDGAPTAEAGQLLVIFLVGAAFMGATNSIRELVRERQIYEREWSVGLSPGAYLGAKLFVLTAVCVVQAVLFVEFGLWGRAGPAAALALATPTLEIIAVVAATALACSALGLLASAMVSSVEQTMPVLVGLVMTQLVLCGGLFPVVGQPWLETLSYLAPVRWGYAAGAATVDLQRIGLAAGVDPLWDHRTSTWLSAMAALLVFTTVATLATRVRLGRLRPTRPQGRRPRGARRPTSHRSAPR